MHISLGAALLLVAITPPLAAPPGSHWRIGKPIVTYWAGPEMTDALAQQLKEGGWNLVWSQEAALDVVQRHGLRAMVYDAILVPESLDDPAQKAKLDAFVDRVKSHPALYAYFLQDEPSAGRFPALGRVVAYLRERDPEHLAYINLFPTYANNDQLGTKGDTVTAYAEHLRQYVDVVKPDLISYDHYHFTSSGDGGEYFLNLAMIRQKALDAGLPFLNIVQAASWTPSMRVPTPNELRWLVYTTLAYGAQGISYYVYSWPGHAGAMALADGTPTRLYRAAQRLNPQFEAIAEQLQPLRSLGAYHVGPVPVGATALPAGAPFQVETDDPVALEKGILLGYFGGSEGARSVVVVNLDYTARHTLSLKGPGALQRFDAERRSWLPIHSASAQLCLPPGGGVLLKVAPVEGK